MQPPNELGLEVMTPDGRGRIIILSKRRVTVCLNRIAYKQEMKGLKRNGEMHYAYPYDDVLILKGRYQFSEESAVFAYKKFLKRKAKDEDDNE